MTMLEDLRECPFCGGKAFIVHVPNTQRFRPQCLVCGANLGEFKNRADAVESWEKRTHAKQIERDARDATIGAVVWRFIDRMTDVAPPEDSAERILSEFVGAVMPAIKAAMSKEGECRDDARQ